MEGKCRIENMIPTIQCNEDVFTMLNNYCKEHNKYLMELGGLFPSTRQAAIDQILAKTKRTIHITIEAKP